MQADTPVVQEVEYYDNICTNCKFRVKSPKGKKPESLGGDWQPLRFCDRCGRPTMVLAIDSQIKKCKATVAGVSFDDSEDCIAYSLPTGVRVGHKYCATVTRNGGSIRVASSDLSSMPKLMNEAWEAMAESYAQPNPQ